MITHIKRSIPDLRSIKHQPLENKESPCGSPKHGGGEMGTGAGTSGTNAKHQQQSRQQPNAFTTECIFDKETDAVTLSAVQTTSCTCGPSKTTAPNDNLVTMQIDKTRCMYYNSICMCCTAGMNWFFFLFGL